MNKNDELDKLIEEILREEVDSIEISDKEIELEWRKFQKIQRERNQEKINEEMIQDFLEKTENDSKVIKVDFRKCKKG